MFRNKLLFKLIFLFVFIIFTPIALVTYFVYNIILDNYNENLELSLMAGENYINTIFERNANLISGNAIKIKDDYKFIEMLTPVISGEGDVSGIFSYVNINYDYDFICLSDEKHNINIFYSEIIKKTAEKDLETEVNTPVINYTGQNFITLIKIQLNVKGSKTLYMTVGKVIENHYIYELSKILNFDFILFNRSGDKIENNYSTIYDEYGFNIEKGKIKLVNKLTDHVKIFDTKISDKNRKILLFNPKNLNNNYIGAISIVENFDYIRSTEKHFAFLILIFFGLVLIFGIFIKMQIVSPVVELLEGIGNVTHQVENSQPIEPLQIKNKDEIGKLAEEYNKMASNLGRSFARIKYLQSYLLNIFESMPSALIAVDDHGKVTQWNRTAETYADEIDIFKKGEDVWKTIPDLGIYKEELLKAIHDKDHIDIYREPVKNGEKKNVNIHLFPLVTNGVKGSVIRIDDITELKKKEEQLRQAQKMETIGTLAGGIAHDFNNILSGIVGVVSILKYKMNKNMEIPTDLLVEYLDIMEQSGARAGDIVQRLLTLSRKQNTILEKVEVGEVVKHVIKICTNTFDKSIKIESTNIESKSCIFADFTQLEQIILNIFINASHAMTIMRKEGVPYGGILKIEIFDNVSREEASRFTNYNKKREYLKISIKDTGVGMDGSLVKQIFEPFFSTKDKSMGTGLGLTIVYNIIQQFDGFIDIESTPDVGSEFKIYFPKYDNEAEVMHSENSVVVKKGSGTILVVDDEPVLRELATSMLSQAGYDIIIARDGYEGISEYTNNISKIDLVLLDMMMPNMNGRETFEELIKINKNIKVIMTSGFSKDKRVEEALKLGVSDFIQKPYTIYKLSEIVYKVLYEKNSDK